MHCTVLKPSKGVITLHFARITYLLKYECCSLAKRCKELAANMFYFGVGSNPISNLKILDGRNKKILMLATMVILKMKQSERLLHRPEN